MNTELSAFMKILKANKNYITTQQFRTIKGQALSGNLYGAKKGLNKVLERGCR